MSLALSFLVGFLGSMLGCGAVFAWLYYLCFVVGDEE